MPQRHRGFARPTALGHHGLGRSRQGQGWQTAGPTRVHVHAPWGHYGAVLAEESGEFLDQFTYGDRLTDFTLIPLTTFLQRLTKFIGECEDIYEKDVMMQSLKEFNFGLLGGIKHVNIEG